MVTADFKKLSRHELSLSKTHPGQGDGLVFDSGKSFSQNAAKIVFGETEQFSAGMPLTNSFLFPQGTSIILYSTSFHRAMRLNRNRLCGESRTPLYIDSSRRDLPPLSGAAASLHLESVVPFTRQNEGWQLPAAPSRK